MLMHMPMSHHPVEHAVVPVMHGMVGAMMMVPLARSVCDDRQKQHCAT
jgi:hypothetical protein